MRKFGMGPHDINSDETRLRLLAYLLGFMVGDAAKRNVTNNRQKMLIELQLTKKHKDNLRLGEFVGLCANACGLRFDRINDRFVSRSVPFGRYHWKSANSSFVYWLFTCCLGLNPGQLTTWDPVSIGWIIKMPRWFRIGFLQGLADSDGYVHLQDQEVHLIVSPNMKSIGGILRSLRVRFSPGISKGLDILKLKVKDAALLPIFNPHVNSYRLKLAIRLAAAGKLPRGPWPRSLKSYVEMLARRGLSTREILLDVLAKRKLAIRASNVRRHRPS